MYIKLYQNLTKIYDEFMNMLNFLRLEKKKKKWDDASGYFLYWIGRARRCDIPPSIYR